MGEGVWEGGTGGGKWMGGGSHAVSTMGKGEVRGGFGGQPAGDHQDVV